MPKPSGEIQSIAWMTRKEFEKGKYPLLKTTQDVIIPDLIKQGHF